jgi:hypothetical protein
VLGAEAWIGKGQEVGRFLYRPRLQLPASRFARTLFLTIVAAFWIGYPVIWTVFGLNGRTARPIDSLGILSYQFYALLGFFALALMISRRGDDPGLSPSAATRVQSDAP